MLSFRDLLPGIPGIRCQGSEGSALRDQVQGSEGSAPRDRRDLKDLRDPS